MSPGTPGDQQVARLDSVELVRYKKEINSLSKVLRKKERILAMMTGFMDSKRWMVCCTQSRIIFLFKLMFAEPETVEIPLEKIVFVEKSIGLLFGEITIDDDSKKTIIKNVAKNKTNLFVDTLNEAIDRKKAANVAKAAKAAKAAKEELESLGEIL